MKLKDYVIPQYGTGDGLGQEDLGQYSLKNFDLKAYQLAQAQPDPEPIRLAAPEAPPPIEPSFSHAPNPIETAPSAPALDAYDVQFGAHFNLQTVSYQPLSPAEAWKLPRWVVATVGLFFGSAAVLTLVFCVALLRDPKPAPTAPPTAATASTAPAAPVAPVATTSAPPAPPAPIRPTIKPPADPVAARHPSVVRRQVYRPRRVAAKSPSPSLAAQETETATRRPPPDALDKLLGESSL